MSQTADILDFASPRSLVPQPRLAKQFTRIAQRINVEPLRKQILANSQLWNVNKARTDETSPHYGVSDQWLRFRPLEELTTPQSYIEPHFACWYPSWRVLTAAHPIVFGLMEVVQATHLGGILITKIPPGGRVKPHKDFGWHAQKMNCKVHVAIQSNPECINECEGETVNFKTGDAYKFSNLKSHSVSNAGATDRLCLIVTMCVEP